LNRFNWTYLADAGKKHHVGLMHGAKSGHLLVYCDSKILLIDFNVLEDKTYTFFIDVESRHLKQSLLFLAVLIVLVGTVSYFMIKRDNTSIADYHSVILQNNGEEGKAQIITVSSSEITYLYMVNGQSYSSETRAVDKSIVVLENGMPMEEGDEFIITYIPNNPNLNKIDYNRPTKNQVERYRSRTIQQHLNFNPQVDSVHTACLVDIALETKGIKGLADIYFQQAAPEDNPRNNKQTYGRLVRAISFQNKVSERCWN